MPTSRYPSVVTHFYRYGLGNVLTLLASFISFPILTRLLSNEQYGIFGYFDTWLLVLAAIVKLGGQHSIIRMYPHGHQPESVRAFVVSFILRPFRYSTLVWLLIVAGYALISTRLSGEVRAVGWCMVALILPQTWTSYVSALIMAEERSALYMRQLVIQRWLEMAAIVGFVAFVQATAWSAYVGRTAVACLLAIWLAIWLSRAHPQRSDRDPAQISHDWTASLSYSLPLVANEITGVLLTLFDRIMLKHVLNDFTPVGIFSIGAGLAATLNTVLNQALNMAFTQVSVRQFAIEGDAAVVRTKRHILNVLVYAVVLLMVGLICSGRDFMLLLSGHDKSASAPVFVAIGCCYVLFGIVDLCGSGLLLMKRSKTMLMLNTSAIIINAALNLALIPKFQISGAIMATAAGYTFLGTAQYLCCPPRLRALPQARPLLLSVALGALLAGVALSTNMLGITVIWLRLVVIMALALVLFVIPAVLIDPSLRAFARRALRGQRVQDGLQ